MEKQCREFSSIFLLVCVAHCNVFFCDSFFLFLGGILPLINSLWCSQPQKGQWSLGRSCLMLLIWVFHLTFLACYMSAFPCFFCPLHILIYTHKPTRWWLWTGTTWDIFNSSITLESVDQHCKVRKRLWRPCTQVFHQKYINLH